MITEFGAANGTECSSYVTDIINYMAENDEYIGWTAWAAGPLWGKNSPCCSDSLQWGSLEPGSTAADGSPGMYEGVWVEIQPLLPTTLQQNGISNVNGPGGNSVSSSSSVAGCCASSITTAQSTSTSTSTSSPTTTSSGASVPLYGQCGGTGYTGFTVCASGTCKYQNAWYSQCL
jgi:endoglucanase